MSLIAGSEGILGRSTHAIDENEKAMAKEQVELALSDYQAEFFEGKYVEQTEDGTKKEYILAKLQGETDTEKYKVVTSEEGNVKVYEKNNVKKNPVVTGKVQEDGSIKWDDESSTEGTGDSGDKIPTVPMECSVTVRAPKNSVITLKSGETEINSIEMNSAEEKTIRNVNISQGNTVIAICKLNGIEIYRKELTLEENNTINMYPCSENNDGKVIYWYGMELADLTPNSVSYNNLTLESSTDSVSKFDNDMLLSMNDNEYSKGHGIGIYFSEDLSNYEEVQINVSSAEYTGHAVAMCFAGDVPCNYYYINVKSNISSAIPSRVILDVSNIKESSKYVSIIIENAAGASDEAYGSMKLRINEIVLK